MLDRDEKLEIHQQIKQIELAVEAMNGPFLQTVQILKQLEALREAWVDDEIESCDFCGAQHLFSEDALIHGDDGRACTNCIDPVQPFEIHND